MGFAKFLKSFCDVLKIFVLV